MDMNPTDQGLFAPPYYSAFKCIADRCRHSCCIDWEICIDETTYAKYQTHEDILATVQLCEDGPCFALCADGRCPHLNADGLCTIILTHGEDHLSDICREHPRFYHRVNRDRTEVGLGIVCEEACRLILESEQPFFLAKIADLGDCDRDTDVPENGFDPRPQREHILSVIGSAEGTYDDKIRVLRTEYRIPELHTPDEWLNRFLGLEILDPTWEQDLRSMRGNRFGKDGRGTDEYATYYARLLTYFVYRHVSTAADPDDLCARLAFAILSVNMIRSLFEADQRPAPPPAPTRAPDALIDWARRYSAEIEYSEDNTDELIFAFSCQRF